MSDTYTQLEKKDEIYSLGLSHFKDQISARQIPITFFDIMVYLRKPEYKDKRPEDLREPVIPRANEDFYKEMIKTKKHTFDSIRQGLNFIISEITPPVFNELRRMPIKELKKFLK